MYSKGITIFSSEGRLPQVEYAYKAIKLAEVTAIAAKGENSIVVAVQKKVPDKLIDPSTVTHMFKISEHVGACLVGLQFDVQFISTLLKSYANNFEFKNGYEIPASVLAQNLAERHQIETQYIGYRPTAVSAILFGYDLPSEKLQIYKVDPSGYSICYKAVSVGVKEIEGISALEKKYTTLPTLKDTEEFVISTLQSVVGVDFEAKEIEVAFLTKENPSFQIASNSIIDEVLTAVAEKD